MTSNQRDTEQAMADKTVNALESASQSSSSQTDSENQILGKALRDSAGVDLPSANPELRGLLISQMEFQQITSDGLVENATPAAPVKTTAPSRPRMGWWIAIAATGLVATGSWIAFQTVNRVPIAQNVSGEIAPELTGENITIADNSLSLNSVPTEPEKTTDELAFIKEKERRTPASSLAGESTNLPSQKPGSVKFVAPLERKQGLPNGNSADPGGVVVGGILVQDGLLGKNLGVNGVTPSSLALRFGEQVDSYGVNSQPTQNSLYSLQALNDPQQQLAQTNRYQFGLVENLGFKTRTIELGEDLGGGGLGGGGFGGGGLGRGEYERGKGYRELGRTTRGFGYNTEQYDPIKENSFVRVYGQAAKSTFSIDVDTASYANMRRFINAGQLPPRNSIRVEEMVNYFKYDYQPPVGDDPFAVNMEVASCPWNDGHKLLRIGIKGKEIHRDERPSSNIVFLLDVSGSMNSHDKLPLLKRGVQMMVERLNENDMVTIVTYAGNAGLVLPPTSGDQTKKINEAIERLKSGGSTNGSAGIELAYELAQKNFIPKGTNRVILATDGDLNVGITSDSDLVKLIKNKASEGVFLTVLGFGTGNLKDSKMEKLADNGNGIYAYIDSIREANKVLVQQMSASLVTIAKDVKLQLEFNPAEILAYRLIGYENRVMANQDFANDAKDAGEIGAGHTVTALYELVMAKQNPAEPETIIPAGLKYQVASPKKPLAEKQDDRKLNLSDAANSGELLTVFLRHKKPEANESELSEYTVNNVEKSFSAASNDFRFAASVASFGMLLRGSKYAGSATPQSVLDLASGSIGDDSSGYRAEFVDLVRRVGQLTHQEK